MKRLFILILVSLLFISCNNVDYSSSIVGTFSYTVYSENELSNNPDDVTDSFAFCNTKTVSSIVFGEDGTYSLSIIQHLDDITFEDEISFSVEELMNLFERNIIISGKYSLNKNRIILLNDTVFFDGTEISFDEYQKLDAAVGNKTQTVKLSVDEKELNLFYGKNVVTYFRK